MTRPLRREPLARPACTGRNQIPAALAKAKTKNPTQQHDGEPPMRPLFRRWHPMRIFTPPGMLVAIVIAALVIWIVS